MKKKLCSILLALTMVLTLLPVSALAEGGAPAEAEQVAAELLSATDGVVTLASDTSIPAAKLQSAIADGLEINLNGKTLTITSAGTVTVPEGITVKFYNGTILNSTFTRGDLAAFAADKDATLIVDNVTMNTTGSAFFPAGNASAVTVTNSRITAGVYVIGTNASGNLSDNVRITLKDSTLTSTCYQNNDRDTCTVMINVPGTMNIDNCKIYGGRQVLFVRCGTATVNNSTITLSSAYNDAGKYDNNVWGSGNEVPMGAVVVGNRANGTAYDTPATCTLNNTTVTGGRVYTYQKDAISVKLNITGNSTINGAFVNGDGEKGKATIVTESGTYFDLANAVAYAADGATIKLAADTQKDVVIPENTTVTLDLNGHKLTNASGHTITNYGKLTVTGNGTVDNVTHGKGALYNKSGATAILNGGTFTRSQEAGTYEPYDDNGNSWYTIQNDGTMTINAGTTVTTRLNDSGKAVGGFSSLIRNGGNTGTAPTLLINGGHFNGGINTVKNDAGGTLTIKGGDFSNTTQYVIMNWNIADIYDGTFEAQSTASAVLFSSSWDKVGGTLNFHGGNVKTTSNSQKAIRDYWDENNKGNVAVSGGIFTVNPTAYVADTHIARKDSDTKFVVVEKANLTSGVYTTSPEGALAAGYIYYQNGDGTYTVYYPVPVIPNNNNNSSSTTTKNPDGSTTTTTTDKATGAVTETTTTANGSVGTVKTDANGSTEISASISAADVKAAEQKNAPVIAPITVAPAASSAAAPVIKLSVPANAGEVAVAIPVVNAKQGTVAVRVNPDGTEEIIKTAVITENGLVLGVKGSMQIKVINNSKNFVDTVGHWAASDVDFVSARELFNGTAPALFSPEASMTRGMVVTVIARLAGENTDGGANWYDKGCAWAVANGVSDGTDPNGSITREQLAAMLYRYCGSPAASGSLSAYADAASVSAFASDAMQWCVNNGIINGMDGLLNPQGQATRAQVSAMFARYIRLAAAK